MSDADALVQNALAAGLTVTVAESCTGGMVAAAITDIAGASAVFERGFLTYSNRAKIEMLGVSEETLRTTGAVSEETAREMAEGARRAASADLAVSITGIAGPGGSDFKPEGQVCFGLASAAGTEVETVEFGALGRSAVRSAARDHAVRLLIRAVPQK
ncbi:CinA family protein [Primorskyibacter sp. S187A]|uniref:CinA family protein n=1 Tax=Primorskyibacter sp. S187A TaxID=3415130 RepID=UPI003C7B284F